MNSNQQLIAFIGVALIGLTIWQHWQTEIKVMLFNTTTLSDLTKGSGNGTSPKTDQFGNPDPNGQYYVLPPDPKVGNGGPTIMPIF